MQEVIKVVAMVGNHELGWEEYEKGTQWNHIKEGLIKKYGQIASFNIHIPSGIDPPKKKA